MRVERVQAARLQRKVINVLGAQYVADKPYCADDLLLAVETRQNGEAIPPGTGEWCITGEGKMLDVPRRLWASCTVEWIDVKVVPGYVKQQKFMPWDGSGG